jgi:vacuolar-type H+-ATPase subunit E/Vma4
MKFRADARQRAAAAVAEGSAPADALSPEQERVLQERAERAEREERAYRVVYDAYMQARGQCGQSTDMGFDAVRDALKNQVRQIKSQFNCESVKFRVVVEEGKARLKALPQNG